MYEVKIKALIQDEKGKEKFSKFSHLVSAVSCYDALIKTSEDMDNKMEEEDEDATAKQHGYEITNVDQSNIESVLLKPNQEEQSGLFKKVKVVITDVDQHSGKEKKTNYFWLVEADSTKEADERMRAEIAKWLVPAEISDITRTNICEYIA